MKIKRIIKKLKLKPLANYQLAYFILLIPFFRMINIQYDNDFWFTINQGKYVLEHSFPTIAINSIHNVDFIYQSWGTGVTFYLIYNYLGLYGMIFLLLTISTLTLYFFYKLCLTVSNNKRGSLYITILASFLYSIFIVTRPHMFTIFNLVLILYLLEKYIKTDNHKYLYWLPLITLFQVNMHGIYFILLLIILTPYLINSFKFKIFNFIKSDGYRKKPLVIAFIMMLLTGFINPYGYKTIIYGFASYGSSSLFNNTIIELMALNFHDIIGKIFIITIITVIVLHFAKLKNKPLRYTLLILGTSYLAFDALKSFYLFLFCSLFPLACLFSNKNDKIDNTFSKKYHLFHLSLTIILCIGTLFIIRTPKIPNIKEFIDYLDSEVTNKEDIKLFTNYIDGSYAEYRGYNCYLDPRGEVFLKVNSGKEDIYEEFNKVSKFEINYKEFVDKYQFDYMLINNESSLGYLMKYDSYKYIKIMEDDNHTLYKLNEEGKNESN